jgi:hypothetical protein
VSAASYAPDGAVEGGLAHAVRHPRPCPELWTVQKEAGDGGASRGGVSRRDLVSYLTGCEFQIPQNARRLINV